MKDSGLTTRTWMLLIGAALLVAAGTLNFAQRLTERPPPTDGVYWEQTSDGKIHARKVDPKSAAGRTGILGVQPNDRLVAVSFTDEKNYEQIERLSDLQIFIEMAGLGGHLQYLLERAPADGGEKIFYHVALENLGTIPGTLTSRALYINFVGIVYLLVGLFVLFKQGARAPFVPHFAALCLAAFVFHFYQPYGSWEDLDLTIAFLDDAALALFAPLFLHFCATYPVRYRLFDGRRWLAALLYAPAAVLIALSALYDFGNLSRLTQPLVALFPAQFSAWLWESEVVSLTVALVAGATLLVRRFVKSESAVVRQQLKWVVWGSALAVAPFTLLYALGYVFDTHAARGLFGETTERWITDAALWPLVLIPLTFGNSVVRYRLMDVDIVVRRTAVYALTTLAIALGIGATIYVLVPRAAGLDLSVSDDGGMGVSTLKFIVAVAAMAVIVMVAAPLKNFLQEQLDRFFYGERYDLRNGLLDFGRTLSATTTLDPLLDALASRLQQVLGVERIAIFIEDRRAASGYRVARAAGLSSETLMVPPDFREMIRTRSAETGIVRADDLDLQPDTTHFVRRALHYYVPCVVRGRLVAVIGLGRSTGGALLSSEDLEILRTVSGYVAVAIENSLLYEEQRERAAELELLKEFNESIVESINVGLLAVDTGGRVTGCNSSLEEMLGVGRDEATGRRVEDLFAEDFAETLGQVLGGAGWDLSELRHIYKLHTATRSGRSLILNIALAPLRRADSATAAATANGGNGNGHADNNGDANGSASPPPQHTGALMVLEDVTGRVRLEEQLQQREKLSSIGLLAAGVAHEINTPLTGVSSYTQMLLGMLAETDPKHALLQKIRRQTDRATGIVNNLLNFSRTGNVTELGEVEVARVLDDTLQLLEPQLRQSRVEIARDFAPGLPRVYANAQKLQQVFTNLILNARDAIPEGGGTITLSASSEEDGDTVTVEVSDTGIGIAPENVARIYDPFFTTKGVGRGTGLGLAVTYGIVQEHSGHISVRSAPGKGTTFRITLPTAHARTRLQAVASD